jgi:DNA-binding NtrC family response regulator
MRFSLERLRRLLAEGPPKARATALSQLPPIVIPIGTTLRDAEREIILRTLLHLGGNKSETATVLGTSRRSLYTQLHRYEKPSPSRARRERRPDHRFTLR